MPFFADLRVAEAWTPANVLGGLLLLVVVVATITFFVVRYLRGG